MKLILSLFLFASLTISTAQVQPITAELGPAIFSTLPQANGYQWVARGYIYPPGTYTPKPGESLPRGACEFPDGVQSIGSYAIFGSAGFVGEHLATYRVTIRGESFAWSGLMTYYEDGGGAPGSMLYSAGKLQGGRIITEPQIDAEYAPRSTVCFGGQVKIFIRD